MSNIQLCTCIGDSANQNVFLSQLVGIKAPTTFDSYVFVYMLMCIQCTVFFYLYDDGWVCVCVDVIPSIERRIHAYNLDKQVAR